MKKKTSIIAVVSAKGGVGKSTTAINLAMAFTHFGKDTTLVDANLITPNIGVYLGVPILPITLHDALKGKKPITKAVYLHKTGTKIVPASISFHDIKKVNHDNLPECLNKLKGTTDILLLDTPAGLAKETIIPLKAADDALIITNPEMPSLTDALKTVKLCQELKKNILGVVVTKTNSKNEDLSIKDIEAMLELEVIGIIPEDRAVKHAQTKKDAVFNTHPESAAALQYKKLAAHLLGVSYHTTLPEQSLLDLVLKFFNIKE
ncbi:MAG TPA: cell division ATPase MinD [Candidatus Nanoarchaeia archaeon]|nr:cell division ATPase MinD [Candidatus Nanoarchaeia archaeon]